MAITPIQPNIENTKSHRNYREADTPIKTDKLVKPLPPQGHIVHDGLLAIPKYFVKDIAYDIKAVKDGFKGEANDHELGRMNDVGLKLAGIGIATYLASKTTNPVARVMEYAGLGAFLAAMSLYPKAAIKLPLEAIHGFDTGVEYIDDQGRKKSMMQDQNYIPFDMYQGEYTDTDLDKIGDDIGIPRNIKNRHDLIKEQMRKISIQNNTLGVLTIGFATPVLSALTCYGLEKLIAPAVEQARNIKYDTEISHYLKKTESMSTSAENLSSNNLSRRVESILKNYNGKELPKVELDRIIYIISKETDNNLTEGIKEDLIKVFRNEYRNNVLSDNFAEETIKSIEDNLPAKDKNLLRDIFVPTKEEIMDAVRKSGSNTKIMNADQLQKFRGELKNLYDSKINSSNLSKDYLKAVRSNIINDITTSVEQNPSNFVNETTMKEVIDYAKIMGEFKSNQKKLDKCKSFKFEYAPETVMARAYSKFEKTLFEVLDIKFKDLKPMRESEKYAQEILETKINNLVKDETKYQNALNKLANVIAEMEETLDGKSANVSHIKDLITAIENNYNNTAKRLNSISKDKFKNTINRLVKEDVSTLSNSLQSKEDLIKLLDGTTAKIEGEGRSAAKKYAKGVGSSKNNEISRIVDRYQGSKNTMNRMLHTLDVYGRTAPEGDLYGQQLLKKGKEVLLTATSSDHNLKIGTTNNQDYYADIFKTIWGGQLSDKTKHALDNVKGTSQTNMLERFQNYLERFKIVVGNNTIDFTKPKHIADGTDMNYKYHQSGNTRLARFNLIAQSPVEFVKNAANKKYGTQLWFRRVTAIMGGILGVTLLAQLGFGKIKNPHNIQKQVSDDKNS